jgi:RNA polymerase sigma factor (sigma-70 family)
LILTSRGDGHRDIGSALPWEYERALIQRIQAGDASAEPVIVRGYSRLVKKTASRLLNPHARRLELQEDMAIEGQIAVIRASRSFNLSKGNKFYPYCKPFVYLSMWTVSLDYFSALRLPATLLRKASQVRAGLASLGSAATPEEIAEFCGLEPDDVREIWSASNHAMRYDHLEDPDVFADGEKASEPEHPSESMKKLIGMLAELDQCERDCLEAVYAETGPIEKVAESYGLHVDDARDIARRSMERMRLETIGVKQFVLPGVA